MCLLIVKPKGAEMPKYSTFLKAYIANPHGCGFASTHHSYKCLNFSQFISKLDEVDDEEACIIHFRLATHGSIKRSNCHPFKHKDVFFAHNGILHVAPYKDKTDSETAFRKMFVPVIDSYGLFSKELDSAVNSIIGYSKFAFLQDTDVRMFGNFTEIDGCYYSNLRFIGI